jgi:hypothetical protein
MALPRTFRRLRVGLIGFGDIARRLLKQRLNTVKPGHGPRWIAVSRKGAAILQPKETQHCKLHGVRFLPWNLDQSSDTLKMAKIMQACVIFAPPPEQGLKETRMRRFSISAKQKVGRLPGVYISTTGVYGDYQGGVVCETSACRPTQARSLRRLDAEQVLRQRLGMHVLRVPGIYAHDRLPLDRLKAKQPALNRTDDVFTNHIHADDLARICWHALFFGKPKRVTNAVDQTQMKMADYFDAVATATGLPLPPRISKADMAALGKTGAVNPMMLSFLSESRRVTANRLQHELKIRLQYPTVNDTLNSLSTISTANTIRTTSTPITPIAPNNK